MINPFIEKSNADDDEKRLIESSLQGNLQALEKIIFRHQAWIYNIALRMVCDPDDAQDITQEILVKVITKMSQFDPEKASFRTWLYRIVANYVLSMKRTKYEAFVVSFEENASHKQMPDQRPDSNPENELLLEESKIGCYLGSLLCFSRKERLVFILGAIFSINSAVGSEIVGITSSNYRKILSRSRKKLSNFVNHKCGLLNQSNPCHCSNYLKEYMDAGWLNPDKLVFFKGEEQRVKDIINARINDSHLVHYRECVDMFRDHPFYTQYDFTSKVSELVKSNEFKQVFHLH
ncbi:RNA polymerase sigma factor [bacterium]|nr:RNA polymerase sigma factor [bacterium]